MPIKVKGKVYKTVVRPTMTYAAECWALKKSHMQSMHTTEMRMLRWAGGVTMLDKVRNTHIRGSFGVAPINEKITESRLRWYGHIMRRPEDNMMRRAMNIETNARRPGRPLTTWCSTIQKELRDADLRVEEAQDRSTWRRRTRRADPK